MLTTPALERAITFVVALFRLLAIRLSTLPLARRRRISYRRRLTAGFLLRYAACLALAAPALAVALASGALVPLLLFALLLYPACGFYLRTFLHARVIWLAVEPARRIGEDGRAMLWLWPVQGARFLRRLRAGGRAEALSPAE